MICVLKRHTVNVTKPLFLPRWKPKQTCPSLKKQDKPTRLTAKKTENIITASKIVTNSSQTASSSRTTSTSNSKSSTSSNSSTSHQINKNRNSKFRTKACCKYKAWHKRTLSRSTIDMGILIIRRMHPYGIFFHLLWISRNQKHGDHRTDIQSEVDRKGHNGSKASSPLSDCDLPMELSRS
jgi:hypothetical protein